MSVRSFCISALLFGSLFVFIVPPFQVADEFNHFYRAWQVSDGIFVGVRTADNRLGGDLPLAVAKITQPFRSLPFHFENQIKSNTIFYNLSVPLDENKRQFVDFANTAIYAPTAYLPQAVAISIGKFWGIGPLSIFYFSRFLTLLFWLSMVYASLKILPIQRNLFVGLALLPSSLFINASASGDVVTNACSFLFIALCLKFSSEIYFYNKQIVNSPKGKNGLTTYLRRHQMPIYVLLMFLTSLIMSLNKVAYFPLVFLFFLIKKEHVNGLKNKIGIAAALVVSNLTAIAFWSKTIQPIYIKFEDYNPIFRIGQQLNENVDPSVQLSFILHNPLYFSKIATFSLLKTLPHTLIHYIGKFGWEKNYLPIWLIAILLLLLLIQAIFGEKNQAIPFFKVRKIDEVTQSHPVNRTPIHLRKIPSIFLRFPVNRTSIHLRIPSIFLRFPVNRTSIHLRIPSIFLRFCSNLIKSKPSLRKPEGGFLRLSEDPLSKWRVTTSRISGKAKFSLLGIGIITTYSFAAAMYGIWCPVGSNFIENLGGKYFIPIYPLFFLALPTLKTSSRFETSTMLTPPILRVLTFLAQPKVLFYTLQLSLIWSVVQVIMRYYG